MSEVRISIPNRHVGPGKVEIDGVDVSDCVRSVAVDAAMGDVSRVVIELTMPGVEYLGGDAKVEIDESAAAVLRAAGWTAPDEVAQPMGLTADAVRDLGLTLAERMQKASKRCTCQ